jgi:hypothetical protein
MSAVRRLWNFWVLWVTTIVLACFSNAVAQASYRVTDLGAEGNDNLGCAMSLNDQGWTEIMAGNLPPGQQDNLFGQLLNGRALIDVDGFKLDLGTLGGTNTWTHTLRVARFFGNSSRSALSRRSAEITGRQARSTTVDKS